MPSRGGFGANLLTSWGAGEHEVTRVDRLTQREREIVRALAGGASDKEIAKELHLSVNTVRSHVQNAIRRMGARSREHAVALLFERE